MQKKQYLKIILLVFLLLVVPQLSRAALSPGAAGDGEYSQLPGNGLQGEPAEPGGSGETGETTEEPDLQDDPDENYTWHQFVRMFEGTFYLSGSTGTRTVALTFDDGPDAVYTPMVLDVLKEHNVPATFFLIGRAAEKYPEVVARIADEGHVIGNHTWSHPRLPEKDTARLREEMLRTEDVLASIIGQRTALIRPPYGFVSKAVLEELAGLDYRVINWTADSKDWRDRTVEEILANTLPDVRADGILLFHSAGGAGQSMQATVDALSLIIEILREQGYSFVTVDELLGVPAYR